MDLFDFSRSLWSDQVSQERFGDLPCNSLCSNPHLPSIKHVLMLRTDRESLTGSEITGKNSEFSEKSGKIRRNSLLELDQTYGFPGFFSFAMVGSGVAGAVWRPPVQFPLQEPSFAIHKTRFEAYNRSGKSHGLKNNWQIF